MKPLILLALLLPLAVGAQVRKCQIDGKTVYSDSQCGQQGAVVNTTANTVDSSGLRAQVQRDRDEAQQQRETLEQEGQVARLTANPPVECRFKSYKYGDAKGKALADSAKAECIRNAVAKQQGKPTTNDAYTRWKDNYEQTAADRRAAVEQISAAENARRASDENRSAIRDVGREVGRKLDQQADRKLTCTADRYSSPPTMTCK